MWMRTLILCAEIILTASACFGQTAVIEGGSEFKIGEKILFDASESDADSVAWLTMDAVQFQQFDKQCAVWAKSGKYSIVLVAVKTVDGTAKLATQQHVFTVGDGKPEPPGPGPGPGPEPEPEPEPTPEPDLTGLALEAYQQASAIDTKPGEAGAVGEAFAMVSTQSAALGWTMQDMSDALKSELSTVMGSDDVKSRWRAFNAWMGGKMSGASTPADARQLLNEMAKGLKAVDSPTASVAPQTLNDLINETFHRLESANERIGR